MLLVSHERVSLSGRDGEGEGSEGREGYEGGEKVRRR